MSRRRAEGIASSGRPAVMVALAAPLSQQACKTQDSSMHADKIRCQAYSRREAKQAWPLAMGWRLLCKILQENSNVRRAVIINGAAHLFGRTYTIWAEAEERRPPWARDQPAMGS